MEGVGIGVGWGWMWSGWGNGSLCYAVGWTVRENEVETRAMSIGRNVLLNLA